MLPPTKEAPKQQLLERFFWQDLRYANGTLEEWVKKSDEEFAAIDEEIRQIRELLDEN